MDKILNNGKALSSKMQQANTSEKSGGSDMKSAKTTTRAKNKKDKRKNQTFREDVDSVPGPGAYDIVKADKLTLKNSQTIDFGKNHSPQKCANRNGRGSPMK